MKRLLLPKNKVTQVAINVAFIVIWEELAGLIVEIVWKTIGELEFFQSRLIPSITYRNFIFDFTYFVFHLLDMVG